MAIENPSFETQDPGFPDNTGFAEDWTLSVVSSEEEWMEFNGVGGFGWDDFSLGWSPIDFIAAFQGLILDLDPATFNVSEFVERFEINWGGQIADLVSIPAIFAPSSNGFEDFEDGWGGVLIPSLPAQTVALFDTLNSFENFSDGWGTFVVVLPSQTTAMFDAGANAFENFEGTWDPLVSIP